MAIKNPKNRYGGCSYCYQQKHDAHTCPRLALHEQQGDTTAIKFRKKLNGTIGRLCSYCGDEAHNSTRCGKRFDDHKTTLLQEKITAEPAFAWLQEIGFGVGCMISGMAKEYSYYSRGKEERVVIIGEFRPYVLKQFVNELLYGSARNWYSVDATDTANETIKRIYLPFHPVYAPRPTSMKVEIIHKANPEDTLALKNSLECYKSPLMNYSTAEDFFNAGYKFKSGMSSRPEIDDSVFKANSRLTGK